MITEKIQHARRNTGKQSSKNAWVSPSKQWWSEMTAVSETAGNSLTVCWLKLHVLNAGGLGSIPGQGT